MKGSAVSFSTWMIIAIVLMLVVIIVISMTQVETQKTLEKQLYVSPGVLKIEDVEAVSYTHLTLPTN